MAGSCLASGYEATHRLMILKNTWHVPEVELLKNQRISHRKKLDSNFDGAIDSSQNSKRTQLNKSQDKFQKNLFQLQDKEMQKLLNALNTSLKDTQSKKLNLADTKSLSKETTFDELFETLPRQ